ncbi:hypothetical protein C8R43DRAFT_90398 [Mycena crocata]|nr:hypothetical protein C8R43DRAFT_90398 [Mycena crocata]
MPPQRADAAHIAPYLTHLISHHGQVTLVPPDNNGRRRKAKQNRPVRDSPREEPVRFNSGPTASFGRPSRRTQASRTDEQYNDFPDDIPDYPPPSFLEAISSPSVSVCPSTIGHSIAPQASRRDYESGSDSGSDDNSLDIVETTSLRGSRRPALECSSLQSQPPRGRGILDSDPDDTGYAPSLSNPRAHRRHLSLSPLRTLFPSRNARESGHTMSAQSTPSPHSLAFSRSSPFFRSTTSLRNLTSSTPFPPPSPSSPPSIRSENFLGPRRFFSHKGKERASEALDSWEIVESEHPVASTIAIGPAPVPSPRETSPIRDVPSAVTMPTHPLSERDRQSKAKNWIPPRPVRERERRAPPPPPSSPSVPPTPTPGEGPPIVTVRTKKAPPPPPPKKKPQPGPSPLRPEEWPPALLELDLDRAVRTPLPLTPVAASPTSLFCLSDVADGIPSPVPRSASGASEEYGNVNVDTDGQMHPHHYPGRPLPPRPRLIVDSTYAPHPDFPQIPPQPPSVPEGLLIDLDATETTTVRAQPTQPLASVSTDLHQLTPTATEMQRASSASSVDLVPIVPSTDYLEVTDLDVLLARLENGQRDGGDYDVRTSPHLRMY